MKGTKTVLSLMQLPVTNYSHNESESLSNKSDNNSESDGYHSETELDEQKYKIFSQIRMGENDFCQSHFLRNLIEEYNQMYKSLRLDTLKSLSDSNDFHIAESVKLKILFSIVVVSTSIYHLKSLKLW